MFKNYNEIKITIYYDFDDSVYDDINIAIDNNKVTNILQTSDKNEDENISKQNAYKNVSLDIKKDI